MRLGPARILAPLAAALSIAAAVAGLPTAAAAHRLQSPSLARIGLGGAFRDSVLRPSSARRLAAAATWGGTFTASTGEQVAIRLSDSYAQDAAIPQRWANFLASLVHGSELATLTLYLAPLAEVQGECGKGALACYGRGAIVAPGEAPTPQISAEAVITHEYGHHVAGSRSNAPWPAIDWGTKRWASYTKVCARSRTGELFPGNEQGERYMLNPGEGFAESYRVLNERRAGIAETPWLIVSRLMYPDETALSLLAADVTSPWTSNSQRSFAAALTARKRSRTYSVATPYDGTLRVSLRATKARLALELVDGSGARVSRTVVAAGATRSVTGTICGSRTLRARVSVVRGSGRFRLAVSKP